MKPDTHKMIIWWSVEDEAHVVEVPELPGCMAHRKTRLAAIRNAEDLIRFWIKTTKEDDLKISQPRGSLVYA
jgi:predicted RNase H-like HicB family nuclease